MIAKDSVFNRTTVPPSSGDRELNVALYDVVPNFAAVQDAVEAAWSRHDTGYTRNWQTYDPYVNGAGIHPHSEHQTGNDVDGWYQGYDARDAATANRMIELLDAASDRGYPKRVERVLVTYAVAASDPFYAAIETVELKDGRKAIDVIVPASDHADHFHWDITDD